MMENFRELLLYSIAFLLVAAAWVWAMVEFCRWW